MCIVNPLGEAVCNFFNICSVSKLGYSGSNGYQFRDGNCSVVDEILDL